MKTTGSKKSKSSSLPKGIAVPQEPPWYEFLRRLLEKEFSEACNFLETRGLDAQLQLYKAKVRSAIERGETLRFAASEEKGWKWMMSVIGWAHTERVGRDEALNYLPMLMQIDCAFFLGQPWVRRTLAIWHEQGEEKKVQHAFFGSTKKGIRTHKLSLENYRRNVEIFFAVQRELSDRYSYRESLRRVTSNLKQLGINDVLSYEAVRKIYRTFDPLNPPYLSLFSPR